MFAPVFDFTDMENDELELKVKVLVSKFKKDLAMDLFEEILHLKNIYKTEFESEKNPLSLLQKPSSCICELLSCQ